MIGLKLRMMARLGVIKADWKKRWMVLRLERAIQQFRRRYYVDIGKTLEQIGIDVRSGLFDQRGSKDTVLVYWPSKRAITVGRDIDPADVHLAMAMLVVHLAVTHHSTNPFALPKPYVVKLRDLHAAEGPEDNTLWTEHMHALDLVLPTTHFLSLKERYPEQASYVIQRVMGVTYHAVNRRAILVHNKLGPLALPKDYRRPPATT